MDIRAKYIKFFQARGHKVYESMPLVPDDASLLFTNAGMVQFKDIFTGKIPTPTPPRATSSQLCIRAGGKHNDLENVGYTARHHTLFEMLGNFSFGDYFKKEAIAHAWEFVTEVLGFDKSVLYVTIHESDDEAYELWCAHIEPSRIKRMGDKDNFWQMGDSGPCGPCSEIYVDQGAEFFHSEEDYFGGEGDRYLEIWNLVFMQYEQKEGIRTPLPKPSIDTGMGLERVVALKEGRINNFDSSLFAPLMRCIEGLTGLKYIRDDETLANSSLGNHSHNPSAPLHCGARQSAPHSQGEAIAQSNTANTRIVGGEILESQADSESSAGTTNETAQKIKSTQASFRVIADHARSVAFLLAQGVNFDKEGRGYVLRRILRRAVRHGYLLGLKRAFLYEVVGAVCESMGAHYGYLLERKSAIQEQCKAEEERFFETIESGMSLFNAELEKLKEGHSACSEDNSSLGNHSPDCAEFGGQSLPTQVTPAPKSAQSKQSNTAKQGEAAVSLVNTRIVGGEILKSQANSESNLTDSRAEGFCDDFRGFQGGGEGVTKAIMTEANNAEDSKSKTRENTKDSKVFDEKSGLSSESARSYLSGSDEARARRIADLSQKTESYTFSGEVAFKLYDTYGFPLDLTQDMLREYGIELDMAGFEACMQEQKNRGKASWKGSGDALKNGDFNALVSEFGANNFVGYECVEAQSRILALLDSSFKRVDRLASGEEGWVMLDRTPFYPEGGGPVGDKGLLLAGGHSACGDFLASASSHSLRRTTSAPHSFNSHSPKNSSAILECQTEFSSTDSKNTSESHSLQNPESTKDPIQIAQVLDTQKFFTLNLSHIRACQPIKVGDSLTASVDSSARAEISKHHSATHLLHYALRQILGSHIAQAGSLVEANRLRFDFSHPKALSQEELEQIEALVNAKIAQSCPQICENLSLHEAKARGAMALFGEKYGEQVRVVSFGDSIELCGGIHAGNTAEIGSFYIVKESGVSSGVRRIEAVCGAAAYNYGKSALDSIKAAKEALKAQDLLAGIEKLKAQLTELKERASRAKRSIKSLEAQNLGGVALIAVHLDSVESSEAKALVDNAKNEHSQVAILLITQSSGRLAITAGVKGVAGLKAGAWVKAVAQALGGNGGGRDDFATAGVKEVADSKQIQKALDLAKQIARENLE